MMEIYPFSQLTLTVDQSVLSQDYAILVHYITVCTSTAGQHNLDYLSATLFCSKLECIWLLSGEDFKLISAIDQSTTSSEKCNSSYT